MEIKGINSNSIVLYYEANYTLKAMAKNITKNLYSKRNNKIIKMIWQKKKQFSTQNKAVREGLKKKNILKIGKQQKGRSKPFFINLIISE